MREVYRRFLDEALDVRILRTVYTDRSRLALTGYPEGLPCREIRGGVAALADTAFWSAYDEILRGFLDFYRTFFSQVSGRNAEILPDVCFPSQIESVLLFDNAFMQTAKRVRERCLGDPAYASSIRCEPAFKQLIFRHDSGRLMLTISQNSIGNAITELLGVVVKRVPDRAAYEACEPVLIERLLEIRRLLIDADLGDGTATAQWSAA